MLGNIAFLGLFLIFDYVRRCARHSIVFEIEVLEFGLNRVNFDSQRRDSVCNDSHCVSTSRRSSYCRTGPVSRNGLVCYIVKLYIWFVVKLDIWFVVNLDIWMLRPPRPPLRILRA